MIAKKCLFGLVCLLLIIFGAYKNYSLVLVIGIFSLAIILFFPIWIIKIGITAYLKKQYNIDLLKLTKDEVIKDLKKEFPIEVEEIYKINASPTTSTLAITTADIITSKKICSSCKKGEMKEIPWKENFNKFIDSKNLVGEPRVHKCDNCSNTIIQYDEV